MSNCVSCSANYFCGVCATNYGNPVNGNCYYCGNQGCALCNNATLTCLGCSALYTFNTTTNTCTQCYISNCVSCSSNNFCGMCETNYLNPGSGFCYLCGV